MFIYKWIEGEKALNEFCEKRFGDRPHWMETHAKCGEARIAKIYKERPDGEYVAMFILWMEHPNGDKCWSEIDQIQRWSYEQIKADSSPRRNGRG